MKIPKSISEITIVTMTSIIVCNLAAGGALIEFFSSHKLAQLGLSATLFTISMAIFSLWLWWVLPVSKKVWAIGVWITHMSILMFISDCINTN